MNRRSQKARTIVTTLCAAVSLFVSSCTTAKHSDESPLVREVPLQKLSATMSLAQLDKVMHENFVIVTDVRKPPESVKGSFCNIEKCNFVGVKFNMVNPGEVTSADYIIPGVPNKQLGFAALNSDSAIVFYKRGGYAGATLRDGVRLSTTHIMGCESKGFSREYVGAVAHCYFRQTVHSVVSRR
jgi:hypothetical protein